MSISTQGQKVCDNRKLHSSMLTKIGYIFHNSNTAYIIAANNWMLLQTRSLYMFQKHFTC